MRQTIKLIPKKCLEKEKYWKGETNTIYPSCIYFDRTAQKCELNGCIKNMGMLQKGDRE